MDDKILTQHPEGKQGVRIDRAKYETVRDAIVAALREHDDLTFRELTEGVHARIAEAFDGSVSWYVTTVKLDLEARGVLARVPGSRPQRLHLSDDA